MDTLDEILAGILRKLDVETDWDARDAQVEAERERQRRLDAADAGRARRGALSAAGFPARAIEAALDGRQDTQAIVHARKFLEFHRGDGKGLLVLSGGVGCGKSTAATWLAHELGGSAFMRAASFAAAGRYDRETRDRWQNARMLVLDDLGAEYVDAKGSFLVDLDELLDLFYGERRTLVITTNLDAKGFKARYGGDEGRIVSRIREAGVWVDCGGNDMRKGGSR